MIINENKNDTMKLYTIVYTLNGQRLKEPNPGSNIRCSTS